jgi:hypothetical protein
MVSFRKILVTCCVILSLTVSPLSALAAAPEEMPPEKEPISPEFMGIDLFLARPLGLAATVGGTLIFVVSLPFSALGGNTGEAWDSLVVTPAAYTFHRPLGDFDHQDNVMDR